MTDEAYLEIIRSAAEAECANRLTRNVPAGERIGWERVGIEAVAAGREAVERAREKMQREGAMERQAVTFRKAEAPSCNHAVRDKRLPQAYTVHAADGTLLGTVYSTSQESWTKHGRVRVHFRGFARYWAAEDASGQVVRQHCHSRQEAALVLTTVAPSGRAAKRR